MRRPKKPSPAKTEQETPSESTAGPAIHEHIGRQLKAMFDEVVSEPVPERFQKLLEELARKQAKK